LRSVLVDLTGDGKDELVTVANYGGGGKVAVYSQKVTGDSTVTVTLEKVNSYDNLAPFGPLGRGISIVAGDFDADGLKDLGFAQSSGDGEVRLYRSTPGQAGSPLTFFKAFKAFDSGTAVTSLAAGDFGTFNGTTADPVRHDGKEEIVAVGVGKGGPVARIFQVAGATPSLIDTTRPFSTKFRSDISVEVARLNADSTPDLIFTAGTGGGSAVEIWDGTVGAAANKKLATLAVFSGIGSGRPVFASAIDTNGDTRADTLNFVQGGGTNTQMVPYSVGIGTKAGSITTTRGNSIAAVAGSLRAAVAAALNDPGMTRTNTGLLYKEIVTGDGPGFTSSMLGARVDYEGYLLNGDRFDSGTDIPFSLKPGSLITGMTEGLKTMKSGGKSLFIIPADLAYGDRPPNVQDNTNTIPKGATLVFYVKLREFTTTEQ